MFSFFLITSAMVVISQRDLLLNKDLGFEKEQLVMIPLRNAQLKNQESTKREFSNHPNVVSSSIGYGVPGDISAGDGVIDPVTKTNSRTTLYCVDYDYIKTDAMPARLAHLKSTYERLDPECAFTYKFADQNFDEMYPSEEKLSVLFTIFTGLAIAVACLGLFGLMEYSVHQRTKEISIRKVFG